jgi:hypothetical protein
MMLIPLACARPPVRAELQPPRLPAIAVVAGGAAAAPGELDVAGRFRPAQRVDDVCATAWQRAGLRELCEPWSPPPLCNADPCPAADARNALECLLADGADVQTFDALSRHEHADTRLYAREALLRLGGMTTARVIEGLTDPGVADAFDRCRRSAYAWAGTPAYLALLQRHDAEADALLVAFLDSSVARALLYEGDACGRELLRRVTLGLEHDARRGAGVRARVGALRRHMLQALPADASAVERAFHVEPTPLASALRQWTFAFGCEPRRGAAETAAAAAREQVRRDGDARTRALTLENQLSAARHAEATQSR